MGFLMFELSSLGISIIQQGEKNEGMKRRKRGGGEDKQHQGTPHSWMWLSQSVHAHQPVGWSIADHLVAESCLSLMQIKRTLYCKSTPMFGLNKWKKLSSNQKHTMFQYKGDWLPTYNDFTHWWCQEFVFSMSCSPREAENAKVKQCWDIFTSSGWLGLLPWIFVISAVRAMIEVFLLLIQSHTVSVQEYTDIWESLWWWYDYYSLYWDDYSYFLTDKFKNCREKSSWKCTGRIDRPNAIAASCCVWVG